MRAIYTHPPALDDDDDDNYHRANQAVDRNDDADEIDDSFVPHPPFIDEAVQARLPVYTPPSHRITVPPRYRRYRDRQFVRVPRDCYLRTDLHCQSLLCRSCIAMNTRDQLKYLSSTASHYVMPSSQTISRFVDILSSIEVNDIILLRSSLSLVKSHSIVYELRSLLAQTNTSKRIVLFENEFSLECYRARKSGEMDSDYESRLLRAAAKHLSDHWQNRIPVTVIESTTPVLEHAAGNGVVAVDEKGCHWESAAHAKGGAVLHTVSSYLHSHHHASKDLAELYSSIIEAERAQLVIQAESQPASLNNNVNTATQSQSLYMSFLDEETLRAGIKSGRFLSGHLKVSRHHSTHRAHIDLGRKLIDKQTGKVRDITDSESFDANIVGRVQVLGWKHRNRAVDGDEVVVEMLPRTQWKNPRQPIEEINDEEVARDGEDDSGDVDHSSTSVIDRAVEPCGRVVGVLTRHWRPYVATVLLSQSPSISDARLLVVPMDSRIPKIRIVSRQSSVLTNQRIIVRIDDWRASDRYPSGHYVRSIGSIGTVDSEVESLLVEHSISHPPFTNSQMECLPDRPGFVPSHNRVDAKQWAVGSGYHPKGSHTPYQWNIPAQFLVDRRDLRASHRSSVMSIDPIGCVDIDDALSVFELADGKLEVGVHIADVTALVPAGCALDVEARQRGTSVYLVDRRLDMMPTVCAEDLCSLRGGTDRLCVSVIWTFDNKGAIINTWFGRTVVHNAYSLSYEEAQDIVDSRGQRAKSRLDRASQSHWPQPYTLTQSDYQLLYPKINALMMHARRLKAHRLAAGAVELSSLDLTFNLNDNKQVTGIADEDDSHIETHSTIEEWMVAANAAVAYHIYSHHPARALLRHHPHPQQSSFAPLIECAERLGVKVDVTSNATLARSLREAETDLIQTFDAKSAEWSLRVLKEIASRCVTEAQYFSSGDVSSVADFYHYGLGIGFYTHFTSPIRRYSDQIVHRLLLSGIAQDKRKSPSAHSNDSLASVLGFESLTVIASHLNIKNREARMASKESQSLFLALYLANGARWTSDSERDVSRHRVERVTAFITAIRENGFRVVIPALHLNGLVRIVDTDSHSLIVDARLQGQQVFDTTGPLSQIRTGENLTSLTIQAGNRSHIFRLFDSVELWLTLRPHLQRFRVSEPVFRLIWPSTQASTAARNNKAGSQVKTASAKSVPSSPVRPMLTDGLDVLQRLVRAVERKEHEKQRKDGTLTTLRSPSAIFNLLCACRVEAVSSQRVHSRMELDNDERDDANGAVVRYVTEPASSAHASAVPSVLVVRAHTRMKFGQ